MTNSHSPSSAGSLELKPCPFCNRSLEHDPAINATFHPKIPYEEYCPLKGFLFASDRSDIIASWNTRAVAQGALESVRKMAQERADFWFAQAGKNTVRREHYEVISSQFQKIANALAAEPPAAPVETETPVAYVPLHPRLGPLWSDTYPSGSEVERSTNYSRMALYSTGLAESISSDGEPSNGKQPLMASRPAPPVPSDPQCSAETSGQEG